MTKCKYFSILTCPQLPIIHRRQSRPQRRRRMTTDNTAEHSPPSLFYRTAYKMRGQEEICGHAMLIGKNSSAENFHAARQAEAGSRLLTSFFQTTNNQDIILSRLSTSKKTPVFLLKDARVSTERRSCFTPKDACVSTESFSGLHERRTASYPEPAAAHPR